MFSRPLCLALSILLCFNLYADASYCPKISDISLSQKNTWFVPGQKWQSSSFSFADGLSQFVGAYWIGAQYGVMTCLYRPVLARGKEVFNVELLNADLFSIPPDGSYTFESQTSRYYCYSQSGRVEECPFFIMGEEDPLTEDEIYEQISYQFSTHNIF
ncbi:MAG: hypothetical protein CMF46_03765 [Legionellales bacterium]|nr:hypothetical protein [Legionellales bacterium]|tara:strand:- start:251 stop:724 length:474 start_codon:yes stop_codon:yes gene_type:complete